jgi:dTDP-4-dehydrorhamnose 3,5-epimerase
MLVPPPKGFSAAFISKRAARSGKTHARASRICLRCGRGYPARSKTRGKFFAITLSAENRKMLYIPKGFAHGFCVLEEGTEFMYKVSEYYSPEHERGILWSDPALTIPWPKLDRPFILSDKDKKYPTLADRK